MAALKWFSWLYYGLALFAFILAMVESDPLTLSAAIMLCLGGVLLQALHLGLQFLKEIRDALVEPVVAAAQVVPEAANVEANKQLKPTKTLSELQADLHGLKRKLEAKP